MRIFIAKKTQRHKIIFATIILTLSLQSYSQQKITFGIHADPSICWLSPDLKTTLNDGARPGFNFGLTINKYFTDNYSFSSGISIVNAGGRLVSSETTIMEFDNFEATVMPGDPVSYKISYVSIPIGLKLQTNQIGYITFFSDLGIDPKVVTGGKIDIPSLNITKENANKELRLINLSYHITAGIEYSLGGTTALVLGLNFDKNFLDITKDNGVQPADRVSHNILSFRVGVNF